MGCGALISTAYSYDTFSFTSIIGRGSFAVIKQAYHTPTRSKYAAKVINIQKTIQRDGGLYILQQELEAHKILTHHTYICNLYYAFHDNTDCVLILDLLDGGDLRLYIKENTMYTEHSVAFIAACIASALNHVHQHGVIHRDVKPENIVLDGRGYPRLIDFGISHSMGAICTARSGTVGYLAPEVLTSSHFHSFESDFWSLGVVVFELLYSTRPFYRHCPKYYVKYSEKNYRPLWESRQLKAMNVLDTPNGVEEERTLCASSKEDSIGLNLPPELEVPVPMILHCGERPSIACVSLIRGLLDVRITHRLGAGNNYIKLQHHHFFVIYLGKLYLQEKLNLPYM